MISSGGRRPVVRVLFGLVFFGAVLAGLPAAGGAEDAEALVRQGIELRRQGKEKDALELFQRSAQIQKTPRTTAQIGLAEQALGLWVDAEAHVKEALQSAADPWIKKNQAALREALGVIEDHLGTLVVWGGPAGAEVLVDGRSAGTLPEAGPVRVVVGRVTLTVRAPGYGEVERPVDLGKRAMAREHVELRPTATATAKASTGGAPNAAPPLQASAGPESPSSSTLAGKAAPAPPEEDAPRFYKTWWFWTLVGAVAVGAGVTAFAVTRPSGTSCEPGITCQGW